MKKQEIVFTDVKAPYIYEAFGMTEALFDMLYDSMHGYFEEVLGYDNAVPQTKVEMFDSYLSSQTFKDLNFNPATPNEWFMFGFLFNRIIVHIQKKQQGDITELFKVWLQSRAGEDEGRESH